MTSPNNWPQPDQDPELYFRHQEKRILSEQRRPIVRKAADILGPGFAPYATQIDDWNADAAAFNGYFWSVGNADNAPEDIGAGETWLGWSISQGQTGVQRVYNPAVLDGWTRSWEVMSGVRVYGNWASDTEPYYPPYVSLSATATTNIASDAVYHKIALANTVHLDASYYSVAASVVTVTNPGTYQINFQAAFAGGASAAKYFAVGISGLTVLFEVGSAPVTDFFASPYRDGIDLLGGATIQLNGYLGSGGAQNTYHTGNEVSRLTIRRV